MENSESKQLCGAKRNTGLKTELSLGLPGCESPERKGFCGVTIFGKDFEEKTQSLVYCSSVGAKRGFSDASQKWGLSINGGSESKDGVLYSPRGDKNCTAQKLVLLKEGAAKPVQEKEHGSQVSVANELAGAPASKAQVVGWPPIRSFRKNSMASTSQKNNENTEDKSVSACLYVKVSMDGAPYLRKVDLQIYRNYMELSSALEKMFSCFITGQYASNGNGKQDAMGESNSTEYLRSSEYVLTYEDKDGDWMLVGDVPWKMFKETCKKLRIMKGSEAIGLAPNAAEKCKTQV